MSIWKTSREQYPGTQPNFYANSTCERKKSRSITNGLGGRMWGPTTLQAHQSANNQQRHGKRLYDDYIEHEHGALQALHNYLDATTVPNKGMTPSESVQSSSYAARLYTPNAPSTQTTYPLTTIDIADQPATNPYNFETSNVFHDVEQPTKSTRSLLLLTCIKRHGRPVKLHQEFVTHIADDRQLFHALRKIYFNHRQKFEFFWSLRTLHSIHFMRVCFSSSSNDVLFSWYQSWDLTSPALILTYIILTYFSQFIYAGNSYIDVRCHAEICTPSNPCACVPPPGLVPPQVTYNYT